MNFLEASFLGFLQGITEFFPISSSGHLLLFEDWLGLDVEGLKAFDVVLHGGTLLALIILFWKEWWGIIVGSWQLAVGRKLKNENRESLKLLLQLIVATIPAGVVGLLFNDAIDEATRGDNRVILVASFFIFIALLLFLSEKLGKKNSSKVGWKNVITMGIAQAFALLPGVSRSGITIASGMLGGLKREVSAKFSFLMLTPATFGAVILIFKKVMEGELNLPPTSLTLVGFLVSFASSLFFASLLLRFVKKHSLVWFSVYLVLIALVLIF